MPGKRSSRAGTGVYFWAYYKSVEVAKMLAFNWWKYYNEKHFYNADADRRQTAITVTITPSPGGFLDLDALEYREILQHVANAKSVKTPEQIAHLYDTFISELESTENIQVQVVQVSLQIPTVDQVRPSVLYSSYPSYIVRRDHGQIISNIQTHYG